MMQVLLSRAGHHVDVVSNGLEAFDAIKFQKFDIVFMDLHMPVMDGIEASQHIREWEEGGQHTFIVALTASYLAEEEKNCLRLVLITISPSLFRWIILT